MPIEQQQKKNEADRESTVGEIHAFAIYEPRDGNLVEHGHLRRRLYEYGPVQWRTN